MTPNHATPGRRTQRRAVDCCHELTALDGAPERRVPTRYEHRNGIDGISKARECRGGCRCGNTIHPNKIASHAVPPGAPGLLRGPIVGLNPVVMFWAGYSPKDG